jgi:cytochrome P450
MMSTPGVSAAGVSAAGASAAGAPRPRRIPTSHRPWPEPDELYEWYGELRASTPVSRTPGGMWLVTRHADVAAGLRDRRLSSVNMPPRLASFTRLSNTDPPAHRRLRATLSAALAGALAAPPSGGSGPPTLPAP